MRTALTHMLTVAALALVQGTKASAIVRSRLPLSTGINMEWLKCVNAAAASSTPPVIFIHGTFHGAWCWEQHWLERFGAAGIEAHAISLRGTSGSPSKQRSVKITEHVADLSSFINEALDANAPPPAIVGHSFASATVLKYLEAGGTASGVALLCGVPPSGNGPMTMRFLRRDFRQAWSILRGFAFKTATREPEVAAKLFFDERTSRDVIDALLPRLNMDSKVGIDLAHFNANLPSKAAGPDGSASWLVDTALAPSLVLGATRDYVVDRDGVEETAAFLGVQAEYVELPHDIMLCEGWEGPADRVIHWARSLNT